MSIKVNDSVFTLETGNSAMQFRADQFGILNHLWYGVPSGQSMEYLQDYPDVGFSPSIYDAGDDRTYSLDTRLLEYPAGGCGDFRIPAMEVHFSNGSGSLDLRYAGHEIYEGRKPLKGLPYVRDPENEAQSLKVTLRDTTGKVEANLYYIVFEKYDVICRHAEIKNLSDETLVLEKAASASLDFYEEPMDLIHFQGRHCLERIPERIDIPHGITTIASNRGTSSHQHNPGIILAEKDTTETHGNAIGMLLMYSGSFEAQVEKDQMGQARAMIGLNPGQFSWLLEPGETFTTPEAILSFSREGLGKLSHNFHNIIREQVIPPRFVKGPRPILINNWEATYFDFDREKLLSIARKAKDLGIEMFVLDDGWFGVRNNDSQGLGDWHVNEEKLGGTLASLIDEIHAMDLRFGIWVEPEMVSEESNLYQVHPDWAMKIPNRDPVRGRFQLVLNLANPEVVDYIYGWMSDLLKNNKIDYVKWDMNRSITDWYDASLPPARQKEITHRYMLGLYDLLERLTSEFPDVLFEGCSGGGGRFDAGMLFYTPQIWCSDDTDAHERCYIQHGTSFFYPVSTVGAHVSAVPNHQTGREVSLEARGNLAMAGTFGYELDLNTLTDEEQETVKAQTSWYRKLQEFIYSADYYRLSDPSKDGRFIWEFVSPDKDTVLVQGILFKTAPNALRQKVRLRHLDPDGRYILTATNFCTNPNPEVYTGKALMEGGILLPVTWGTDAPVTLMLRKQPH